MIVYHSRTGNVKNIVDRIVASDDSIPTIKLESNMKIESDYFIFTYTDKIGEVPYDVNAFLLDENNQKYLKGVIVSGNVNFGKFYCAAGHHISKLFDVPVIRTIDLRGDSKDVAAIIEQYNRIIKEG